MQSWLIGVFAAASFIVGVIVGEVDVYSTARTFDGPHCEITHSSATLDHRVIHYGHNEAGKQCWMVVEQNP